MGTSWFLTDVYLTGGGGGLKGGGISIFFWFRCLLYRTVNTSNSNTIGTAINAVLFDSPDVVTVVMFFFVITEVTIFLPVTVSGRRVLGFSVQELPVDFTVLECNVVALPTGGAEELPVRGVLWLVFLGCRFVVVAFGFDMLVWK